MSHIRYLWLFHKSLLLCIPPLLYFLAGFAGRLVSRKKLSTSKAWSMARLASTAALLLSLAFCCYALLNAPSLARRPHIDTVFSLNRVSLSFRFDPVESLMLLLVTFLGWVIVNYSQGYMAGDPREPAYVSRLMHTLAAVTLLVTTNSILVFLVAWVLTSLSLHGLLIFYPARQAAVIAAHKKFLASRLGDTTLFIGVLILGSQTGSFELDEVTRYISRLHSVPLSIHVAAMLLAMSAIIKCAQLPLHGWLIQVMEAPTPVSALLHAGIVNLGGFMLIRLSSIVNTTDAAQALLVAVGCLTAVIGSLVMTTRISIKVHLAWSTCAQMGFMLIECGLGLYALAFLHLLAHSLYKAYAFLGSGCTVSRAHIASQMPAPLAPKASTLFVSGLCGLTVAALGQVLWRPASPLDAPAVFCIVIVGFALACILAAARSTPSLAGALILVATSLAVSVLYFGYDALFQSVLPIDVLRVRQHPALLIFVLACFCLLYGIQAVVRVNPLGRIATVLYPWFYAGLYLDEVFTRATFRLWPAAPFSKATRRRDAAHLFEATGESR